MVVEVSAKAQSESGGDTESFAIGLKGVHMSRNDMPVVWIASILVLLFGSALSSSAQKNAWGNHPDDSPLLSCSPAPCLFAPELVSSKSALSANAVAANP